MRSSCCCQIHQLREVAQVSLRAMEPAAKRPTHRTAASKTEHVRALQESVAGWGSRCASPRYAKRLPWSCRACNALPGTGDGDHAETKCAHDTSRHVKIRKPRGADRRTHLRTELERDLARAADAGELVIRLFSFIRRLSTRDAMRWGCEGFTTKSLRVVSALAPRNQRKHR
jgi:hypothetical protein